MKVGPVDIGIFDVENGNCIAIDMEGKVCLVDGSLHKGIIWMWADKFFGSRKAGWE